MKSRGHAETGGRWLVVLAAALWGTTGTAQQFAPVGASPLTVGALRLLVGGAALWTFVVGMGRRRGGRRTSSGGGFLPPWHVGLLGAALGVAGFQAAFFAGVLRTGVAVGTIIAIGSGPVWAGLLETCFLGHRPSGRWLGATAAAIIGCTLLVGGGHELTVDAVGVSLTLAAGAAFALYTVSNKAVLRAYPHDEDLIVATVLLGGGLLMVPVIMWGDTSWLGEPRGIAVVLHLGLLATALPYALFSRGLATTSAASATTLTLAEPLTAAVLGVIVLGETLRGQSVAGGLLVFAGLLLLATAERDESDGFGPSGGISLQKGDH